MRRDNKRWKKTLKLENITKIYKNALIADTTALSEFSFEFRQGVFYAVMGESGAGKSTLLNMAGLMDRPTQGRILIDGEDVSGFNEKKLALCRMKNIGFVFQKYYLNEKLTAAGNIGLALRINKEFSKNDYDSIADRLLSEFGMADYRDKYPTEMSGGQQQRVCMARAIANNPAYVLADEPTGNLDEKNERIVFESLKRMAASGRGVIVVSHSDAVKEYADEILHMENGKC